jgi:c(7)-type cytochrome triheme protein
VPRSVSRRIAVIVVLGVLCAASVYSCTFFEKSSAPPKAPETASTPAPPPPKVVSSVNQGQLDEYEDPTDIPTPGPPYGKENRDPNVVLKDFPVDSEGNVDWVKAFKENVIHPHESLDLKKPPMPPFNFDVEIPAVGAMPNVIYPHYPHTFWLDCGNCHPSIFVMKRGANPISMVKIVNGEFCGRCHGRVAFPISNCTRCHVKPKS